MNIFKDYLDEPRFAGLSLQLLCPISYLPLFSESESSDLFQQSLGLHMPNMYSKRWQKAPSSFFLCSPGLLLEGALGYTFCPNV